MDSVELKKLVKEAIEQETSALRAEIAKMKNQQKERDEEMEKLKKIEPGDLSATVSHFRTGGGEGGGVGGGHRCCRQGYLSAWSFRRSGPFPKCCAP